MSEDTLYTGHYKFGTFEILIERRIALDQRPDIIIIDHAEAGKSIFVIDVTSQSRDGHERKTQAYANTLRAEEKGSARVVKQGACASLVLSVVPTWKR
jgi:hypothetical protein